jgi:hypothetical protein
LTVVNCTVSGNSTSGSSDKGGGIYNGGTATIANSIISGNSSDAASGSGGGIYNDGSAMTITNSHHLWQLRFGAQCWRQAPTWLWLRR